MKFSIATACAAILLAQSANASWTFSTTSSGSGNKGCTRMSLVRGDEFKWDPSFTNCCISLYSNNACTGDPQGYRCSDSNKATFVPLNSYKITNC